jgi:uncharacterized repeat protein (TIGR01451 family)/fimbrial isopeptide formation D2 family protein
LSLSGSTLTWAIPTLAAGATETVSYSVTVDRDGATIINTVSPNGVGGACLTCSTTTHSVAWTLAKTSDPATGTVVKPGDIITYTLTVKNTGPVVLSGANVSDDLSDVVDDATLGALPAGATLTGTTLTWAVPDVPVGGTAELSYTATVGNPGAQLTNTAVAASVGGTCPDGCSTTSFTPKWSLAKASDQAADAVVKPGDTIGYTLTVTNEARTALTGGVVRDDLSDVLDDATLVALPEGATLEGSTLVWTVPEVAVGGTAQLAYQVTLNDDARGVTVHNVAAPASAGGTCVVDGCETTAFTTEWTLAKTSDPGSGATVQPGDSITYTLTVTNTGPVVLSGADVHDNMADLLDDATLVGNLPAGTTMDGTTLTWAVPDVPVGGTVQVHYTVVVKPGAYGITLGNVAWGDGVVSCASGVLGDLGPAADDDCSTRHYSPAWSLSKTSDPGAGGTVVPGDDVTYTLRVRNTSQAVVNAAVVTDDLSDVLTYAKLAALPDGSTLTGSVLTWTVPTLQPGQEATIAYTVTVDEDAYNATFTNTAVPGAAGSCPDTCTATLVTTKGIVDPTHDDDGDGGKNNGGDLAYTGADLSALGLGVVALAAGAGLMVVGRKRRDEE